MPTASLSGDTRDTTAATVDEQFLDLICNDPDLVAAEFDAIIAAEWPDPPARRPRRSEAGGLPGSGRARRAADAARDPGPRAPHPDIDRWARQRSPPLRHLQTH